MCDVKPISRPFEAVALFKFHHMATPDNMAQRLELTQWAINEGEVRGGCDIRCINDLEGESSTQLSEGFVEPAIPIAGCCFLFFLWQWVQMW